MKTGNFTHSMRRNKCRIYSIYSTWNLTKIEWKSFRNERRKCFEMLFEEQIPCSRKILELSGNSESKFQQFKQKEGRAPCPGTIWAVPSGVPRNLTCCPNGDCNSNYTTPDLVPTTYLQIISHSLKSFRPVFERHVKINPFPRTDSTWQKLPEFLQFSTAKIRCHEIRHISLSTWGVWFTLGLVEMPTEERRLVAEDGSKSKNTWLQKIARGWRCLVSSCAGPRHRL